MKSHGLFVKLGFDPTVHNFHSKVHEVNAFASWSKFPGKAAAIHCVAKLFPESSVLDAI